jgi:hypothetical protein
MYKSTQDLFEELIETIYEYESTSFSARHSELTYEEAEDIANTLLKCAIMDMINLKVLDGTRITAELEELREV